MAQQSSSSAAVSEAAETLDPLLLDYVRSTDEAESATRLSMLITQYAEPVIRRAIRHKLNLAVHNGESDQDRQDVEDLHSEAVLEAFSVLRELKRTPTPPPIRDFRGYIAAIGFRVCSAYLRKKRPQRASLKDKVRYILTRRADFALWKSASDTWLCGLQTFREQSGPLVERHLPDSSSFLEESRQQRTRAEELDLGELIEAVFLWSGKPVPLDALVGFLADARGIKDEFTEQIDEGIEDHPDTRANVTIEVEQRLYLERVWTEIAQLPVKQRRALLLNLTDRFGNGLIALLPGVGIASFREVAATLEMTVDQLAELWGELPLNDAAIAHLLGITRQQVINLRKSARERLVRRTKPFAQGVCW